VQMRSFMISGITGGLWLCAAFMAQAAGPATAPTTAPATRPIDEKGMRLIWAIISQRKAEALDLMMQGADVNAAIGNGSTPLYYAAGNPNDSLDIVKALIERGANVNAHGIGGFTPLHEACANGGPEIAAYLISKGADVNAREKSLGDTPLHVVAFVAGLKSRHNDPVKIAEMLLSHGADANALNHDGETPLDVANRQERATDITKLLISKGGKSGKALATPATQKSQ
jgi:hypothetical protein